MEAQQLVSIINACINPDASIRKAGEDALKQSSYCRGGLISLLRVALEGSLPLPARQIAAITIKNCVKKDWEDKAIRPSPFPEEEKSIIRDLLYQGIVHAPPNIRVQLEEATKCIITIDFPQRWMSLVGTIQSSIASGDQQLISGALHTMRIIARKYEFRDDSDRAPLIAVVDAVFPQILSVFQSLLSNPSSSADLAELLKLCCKIFWSSNYLEMQPMLLSSADQFSAWMEAFLSLATRKIPIAEMPLDSDERKEWPWWKMKKWVYKIVLRLASKLGNRMRSSLGSEASCADRWQKEYSMRFLSAVLEELTAVAQGGYIAPRVSNLLLQYVTAAVEQADAWKALKPHIQEIVVRIVIPLLSFNEEDAELWKDDPQEYVRKGYDVIEDIYSSKTAAMGLLSTLTSRRKKSQLEPIMIHVVRILNEYQSAVSTYGYSIPENIARNTDGALLAVGTLAETLKKNPKYSPQLESMLQQHIAPLFSSPHGHLRAKACWLAGAYADAPMQLPATTNTPSIPTPPDSNNNGTSSNNNGLVYGILSPTFISLLQCIINALNDPELPVRVDAGVAIREFILAIETDEITPLLKPLIPDLLERFLSISNEVDSEDLTMALEVVVERFGSEMGPYAMGVVGALLQQFWRVVQEEEDEAADIHTHINITNNTNSNNTVRGDDWQGIQDAHGVFHHGDIGNGGGTLAGFSILNAIITVLDTVSGIPHLYPQLEDLLFPVLDRYTNKDGEDIFQELCEIITCLLYHGPGPISPRMWVLYPRLLQCLEEWGMDYFTDILSPLDNFVSKGTDVFLSNPVLLDATNRVLEKALSLPAKRDATTPITTTPTLHGGNNNNNNNDDEEGDDDSYRDGEVLSDAAQFMCVIMQYCRGRVDACIAPYLSLIVGQLQSPVTHSKEPLDNDVIDALLVAGANALYYDPRLALSALHSAGTLPFFMSTLSKAVSKKKRNGSYRHFTSKRYKKSCILGLCSVLAVPLQALPPEVASSLGHIVSAITKLLHALKAQEEKEKAKSEDSGDGLEDFVSRRNGYLLGSDDDDDDDDDDEEEEEHFEQRKSPIPTQKGGIDANDDDNDEDDEDWDSDDWWNEEEEEEVQSPLDSISPYIFFAEMLQTMQMKEPEGFGALMHHLDGETQAAVQEMVVYANEVKEGKMMNPVGGVATTV